MKYIFLLLLFPLVTSAQSVTNQNIFDTVPFSQEHTPQRLAQFAKEPIVPGRIIFLGNSITERGDWKKVLNDSTVINRGIGGDITYGVLKRLQDITDRDPSKVFILLGINDIGKDIPYVVIADNYLKIVREIHDKCPKTVFMLRACSLSTPNYHIFRSTMTSKSKFWH